MARSIILPRAEEDIAAIFEYHSDQTANRFVDAVISVVERLEQFPESRSPKNDLGGGLQAVVLGEYKTTLYYHFTGGEETVITVLRILRQERDVNPDMFSGG